MMEELYRSGMTEELINLKEILDRFRKIRFPAPFSDGVSIDLFAELDQYTDYVVGTASKLLSHQAVNSSLIHDNKKLYSLIEECNINNINVQIVVDYVLELNKLVVFIDSLL